MDIVLQKKIIQHLSQFVSITKWHKMNTVLAQRTRKVTLVLEDVYQAHNVSAAIRSAECFGIQDVHIIEMRNTYAVSIGVTKGASDWVDMHRYKSTQACYDALRAEGYCIVATSPHVQGKQHFTLSQLPIAQKIAFVFGTEETGLTDYALHNADICVSIPMYGFTESFNISVTASICLYDVMTRIAASGLQAPLSELEAQEILLVWLRRSIRASAQIERRFLSEQSAL